MEFKDYLEERMKKAGIKSFRQLAIKLGLSPSNFATRIKNPTYSSMKRFSEALDCELWELLKPPGNDGVDYKPESRPGKKVERILFEYSDGSCDRFVKDPEPFED